MPSQRNNGVAIRQTFSASAVEIQLSQDFLDTQGGRECVIDQPPRCSSSV